MIVSSSIFREYDIRGTYPEQLNEETIQIIARAISVKCHKEGITTLAVGRDGRLSGESLLNAFCDGLIDKGINVNNVGLVTSPLLYFAAKSVTIVFPIKAYFTILAMFVQEAIFFPGEKAW